MQGIIRCLSDTCAKSLRTSYRCNPQALCDVQLDSCVTSCGTKDQSVSLKFFLHHCVEGKMFGCVAKTIRCAARSQVWIGNEVHDRVHQRLSVTRFDKQTVLAIAKNLWNITDFRRDDWTPTGESFTQDDRRRFGSKGSNNNHVARCINVGCVPAISSHNDS